jgi:hypothetical protein
MIVRGKKLATHLKFANHDPTYIYIGDQSRTYNVWLGIFC